MKKQLDITLKTVSRGGKAGAKIQLHRARAYFDTWIETHPYYKDDFSKINWGRV